jgi:hypothetical protein
MYEDEVFEYRGGGFPVPGGMLHLTKSGDIGGSAVSAPQPAQSPERRTVEFEEKSDSDLRERMAQWQKEGWAVLSVSKRLPQADGTVHRKAELARVSRGSRRVATGVTYDDRRIAQIKGGETTEAQLVEWFGPPESRDAGKDGRDKLSWSFGGGTDGETGHSGALNVNLEPDGKVDAYSAHGEPNYETGCEYAYDDRRIAGIKRGETTEAQLLEWFGPPEVRSVQPDGRKALSWKFAPAANGVSSQGGMLQVSLSADGNVEAYSAHRTAR